ncbi:MAG: DNA repair protein RadC [Candidatus Nanohaloarchaea archaeon]|nr:DNA repair protein RadC [Candidatus Nanohaloarchaea archaeon]
MPSYTVTDLPPSDRPRERLAERGAEALGAAELLAVIIRSGWTGGTALEVARAVLTEFDLDTLPTASTQELTAFDGIGAVKAAQLRAAGELCRRYAAGSEAAETVTCPEDAVPHVARMAEFPEERVGIVSLDSSNTVLATDLAVLTGGIDRVGFDPAAIVRAAVRHRATAVILAHNHPSGDPTPSEQDIAATDAADEALDAAGIDLLDHIIVGEGHCSMAADGYL